MLKLSYLAVMLGTWTVLSCQIAAAEVSSAREIYTQFKGSHLELRGKHPEEWLPFLEEKVFPHTHNNVDPEAIKYLGSSKSVPVELPLVKELAALLTANKTTDAEKLLVIHDFVVWRMTHGAFFGKGIYASDATRATRKGKLEACLNRTGCSPDSDPYSIGNLFKNGIHNCSGYAAMFATLSRAVGFPTQIVQSTQKETLHIWNRVYFRNEWRVVDATFDDAHDIGLYEDDSIMNVSLGFFLTSDLEASRLDPESHVKFEILE
jgi:hypothetical protein